MRTNDIKYAVFILSHGRANNVVTYKKLREQGYTGEICIVCDDLDEQLDEYKRIYSDKCIVFNKREWAEKTDTMDCEQRMDVVVYARNAVFYLAKQCGYKYFIVLDDDYSRFEYRWTEGNKLKCTAPKCLDDLFLASFRFMIDCKLKAYGWEQGGDFIGGASNGRIQARVVRKIMNTYFLMPTIPWSSKEH